MPAPILETRSNRGSDVSNPVKGVGWCPGGSHRLDEPLLSSWPYRNYDLVRGERRESVANG